MNAFHVCGSLFALWAVTVTVIGITQEGFPQSKAVARAVGAISILLAAAAIFSAIYVGATEKKHTGSESSSLTAI